MGVVDDLLIEAGTADFGEREGSARRNPRGLSLGWNFVGAIEARAQDEHQGSAGVGAKVPRVGLRMEREDGPFVATDVFRIFLIEGGEIAHADAERGIGPGLHRGCGELCKQRSREGRYEGKGESAIPGESHAATVMTRRGHRYRTSGERLSYYDERRVLFGLRICSALVEAPSAAVLWRVFKVAISNPLGELRRIDVALLLLRCGKAALFTAADTLVGGHALQQELCGGDGCFRGRPGGYVEGRKLFKEALDLFQFRERSG